MIVSSTFRVLAVLLVCLTTSVGYHRSNAVAQAKTEADTARVELTKAKDSEGSPTLDARIEEIMRRPEFGNARWGMKFYSPDTKQVVYAINSDQLFQPASALKVFVAGTAFSALGPDYRFRTPVYRTGPVDEGILKGDLVLVASGDLLLGGRVQLDGRLALPEPDHTYDMHPDAAPVPGDPLRSIREIAGQVAARGIRRVEGRVLWMPRCSVKQRAKREAPVKSRFPR